MSARAIGLFTRKQPAWQPAPEGTTVPLPRLTIAEQLAEHPPQAAAAEAGVVAAPRPADTDHTQVLPPTLTPLPLDAAVNAADHRQRLRQADELLRTFTISA